MSSDALSTVEKDTLGHIVYLLEANGFAPSVRELSEKAGVTGTAILGRLRRLQRKGYISRDPLKARAIVVLKRLA